MKYVKYCFLSSSLLLLSLLLSSCVSDTKPTGQDANLKQESVQPAEQAQAKTVAAAPAPLTLPVQYQTPSYVVDRDEAENIAIEEESKVKVGARITSTRGPQPLWDILKRLAALKGLNVSWESDVDRNVLVDVNISANDDFYEAIDNMLRQVEYYHEMQGSTIVVKYKETRQFHISMPFIKQTYETKTGGDVLGGSSGESTSNVAGEIRVATQGTEVNQHRDGTPGGVEFNTWNSIENNLNAILNIWTTETVEDTATTTTDQVDQTAAVAQEAQAATATYRRSSGGNSYFIDKPVGLITVTCPRPLHEKLEVYFKTLKSELYKQVSIEAKILEVQLDDSSSIGLNWNLILKNLSATAAFTGGTRYNKETTYNTNSIPQNATIITDGLTRNFTGAISLAAFTFDQFLNVVEEQGQATILSNPKLSVLNGQPSMMTVGRNVTFIDQITSDTNNDTATITYTATTARALSGVGLALTANILDDSEIILNLVPVTSELVEPIEYKAVGLGEVGLPIINVREMSTTVRVKDGEMLVIGGLISSVDSDNGTFVPGTSNIPFFKYLFGFEEKVARKRELIILLRPRII